MRTPQRADPNAAAGIAGGYMEGSLRCASGPLCRNRGCKVHMQGGHRVSSRELREGRVEFSQDAHHLFRLAGSHEAFDIGTCRAGGSRTHNLQVPFPIVSRGDDQENEMHTLAVQRAKVDPLVVDRQGTQVRFDEFRPAPGKGNTLPSPWNLFFPDRARVSPVRNSCATGIVRRRCSGQSSLRRIHGASVRRGRTESTRAGITQPIARKYDSRPKLASVNSFS